MGLLHFCMSCEQKHWLVLDYLFKAVCIENNLEDRGTISLQRKGEIYLLSSIIKIMSLMQRTSILTAHYKRLGFPELGVPLP